MGFLSAILPDVNASLPLNETLLNDTSVNVSALIDGPTGLAELPTEWRGLLTLAALLLVVILLGVTLRSAPNKEPLVLPMVLALLVLSVPVGNVVWAASLDSEVAGKLSVLLGVVQAGGLLAAFVLSARLAAGASAEGKELPDLKLKPSKHDGEEYPHEYVGCMRCGQVLSKQSFFSCQTTYEKNGSDVGYELCRACVDHHDRSYEVLEWKYGECVGQVDFEEHDILPNVWVRVKEDFKSDNAVNKAHLKKGELGHVIRMDDAGNANIWFEAHQHLKNQWVKPGHFALLDVLQSSEKGSPEERQGLLKGTKR